MWKLTGLVHRSPFLLSPEYVDFGAGLVEGDVFPSRQLDIECRDGVADFAAACDESVVTVVVARSATAKKSHRLTISLRPDLPAGDYAFNVRLTPRTSQGDLPRGFGPPPGYPVEVHASIGHEVCALPTSIILGALNVGERPRRMVAFRSAHNRPFHIVDVKADLPDHPRIEPLGVHDNAQIYQITQSIDREGNQASRISFVVKQNDRTQAFTVDVGVSYYGVAR
jgi:hypothetical protein